ncbi:MAG: ribosome maturation factor RimM [Clostridiales bacterium]|nr:ribosome maturation factor RimM [Clostridiales bacterium]
MNDLLQVGIITKAHGVRGEVRVYPTTDDPRRFLDLETVIVDNGKTQKTVEITSVKFVKNMVVLKLAGVENPDEAERLRQARLFVTREQAVPLGEDEYFIADLIDMSVVSDEGEELGTIADVLTTGANDVYVVKKEGANDLLLPAIGECVRNVDVPGRVMEVHLMPGLRD